MIFITEENLRGFIPQDQLSIFCKGDIAKFDAFEASAIQLVKSYIGGKYDCAIIFDNNQSYPFKELIIENICHIAIYKAACANLNPRNIPEERKTQSENAIKWFEKISLDKLNPSGLPLLNASDKSTVVKMGSNTKRSNYGW
jgi:hypothetical protein